MLPLHLVVLLGERGAACRLSEMVDISMSTVPTFESSSPAPEAVTKILKLGDADIAALTGGIVGAVLLALICVIAVLMWCLSRHKGSYITNEMDEDDDIDNDDEEPFCSDMMLQTREPLTLNEDE